MLFAMDCTGSMASFISSAIEYIKDFVSELMKIYPTIPLRLGFIAYRDHCDGENRLNVLRFTSSIEEFRDFVTKQKAMGGGDAPEDIFGALNVVSSLEWASASRILYHIGDAPCHGTDYHDFGPSGDSNAGGDPYGLKAEDLLNAIKAKNVQYFFGKINATTDKMINKFNAIIGGDSNFIISTPMTAATMISTISRSVCTSISASLSSTSRTDGGSLKLKAIKLVPDIPNWTAIEDCLAMQFSIVPPTSVAALVGASDDKCLSEFPDLTALVRTKKAQYPFAKGAARCAYYAKLYASDADRVGKSIILKESLVEKASYLTKEKYEVNFACHAAADFLSKEFNRAKPATCDSIRFCTTKLFHFMALEGSPYFAMEEQVEGTWEKYNNNSGMCATFPTENGTNHNAVQAFCHWTHAITE
jgi:hypothetical protein